MRRQPLRSRLLARLVPARLLPTRLLPALLLGLCPWFVAGQRAAAQEASPSKPDVRREIFVPFDDLNLLLEGQDQRIFLTRKQYDELLAQAGPVRRITPPLTAAILSADYQLRLADERAELQGELQVESLREGVHGVPLQLSGLGLRSATVEGQPVPLARDDQGRLLLLLEKPGRQTVRMELVAPLATSAAQQALTFQLPTPAAARIRLTAAGNVEVKSGASVLAREVDEEAGVTRLELLPQRGEIALRMSLNNRRLRRQQVAVARSVLVGEVTSGYERLHAAVSLQVLHGAVEKARFRVPEGFEVTEAASPGIARWEVVPDGDDRVLEVLFREPVDSDVLLNIAALRSQPRSGQWTFPQLRPLDLAGQVAVVGLLVEDQFEVQQIQAQELIGIGTEVLTEALPESIFRAEPGAPTIRPVAAFYAPRADFQLEARLQKAPPAFDVMTSGLLTLGNRQQLLRGRFFLQPRVDKLFGFDFSLPAGWHVTRLHRLDQQPVEHELLADDNQAPRIRVRLATPLAPGQSLEILFDAEQTPEGWLDDWQQRDVAFPAIRVEQARREYGAIAVQTLDDLDIRPLRLAGLTPLDDEDKSRFGLAGLDSRLAYRFEDPGYEATFQLARQEPTITAQTFAFFQMKPNNLDVHYELAYKIERASTDRLVFWLPESTPAALSIRGLDSVQLKEFSCQVEQGRRKWTVRLAETAQGVVRLAVDFRQRIEQDEPRDYRLPPVQAGEVAFQSSLVAVEGSAELDVEVRTEGRRVDVGELYRAEYQVGPRLLGAFAFLGDTFDVRLDVFRRPGYALPPAVVERAELVTLVAPQGGSQTAARFRLRTKAPYLELHLPAASLWSVYLDGRGVAPQREGEKILISLPPSAAGSFRDLQVVYSLPPLAASERRLEVIGPKLFLRTEQGQTDREVPLADLNWHLYLPAGLRLTETGGSVTPTEMPLRPLPLVSLAGWLQDVWRQINREVIQIGGDFRRAREAARIARSDRAYSTADEGMDFSANQFESSAMPPLDAGGGGGGFGGGMPGMGGEAEKSPRYRLGPRANAEAATRGEAFLGQAEGEEMLQGRAAGLPAANGPFPATAAPSNRQPQQPPGRPAMPQDAAQPEMDNGLASATPPVPDQTPTEPTQEPTEGTRIWALEGLRSLQIQLTTELAGRRHTFESLGADPVLTAGFVDGRRIVLPAWAVALVVLLVGVLLTGRRVAVKARYMLLVGTLALLLPLLTPWHWQLGPSCDAAFFAVSLLLPYYLLAGLLFWFCRTLYRLGGRWSLAAPLLLATGLATVLLPAATANAQPPEARMLDANRLATGGTEDLLDSWLALLRPAAPLAIPPDAIVVPYDAGQGLEGARTADKLLVPYARYVELWNQAHPDRKLLPPPPVAAALSAASYQVRLEGDQYVLLRGVLQVDVLVDKPIVVPLPLQGGVLIQARLDGQPARIDAPAAPLPADPNAPGPYQQQQAAPQQVQEELSPQVEPQSSQPASGPEQRGPEQTGPTQRGPAQTGPEQTEPASDPPLRLHVSGAGRKRLELAIRFPLRRQGGWRVVEGRLPRAAATALDITLPKAGTDVRLSGVLDRTQFESARDEEVFRTALADQGFGLRWRPRIAEGQVDRDLTAESLALLEVQEDGLQLRWNVRLEFRRDRRESFSLRVPEGYLVEQVLGENIRGWQVEPGEAGQQLDVELLKPATAGESFTLELSRRGPLPEGEFLAPIVQVPDAVLHQGRYQIRRSPLLELQTGQVREVSRTDAPERSVEGRQEESPLGLSDYQTYRFVATPFAIPLRATSVAGRLAARWQTILRVALDSVEVESRLQLTASGRPAYTAELLVDPALNVEEVILPENTEWTLSRADGEQRIYVIIKQGLLGNLDLILRGRYARPPDQPLVSTPRLEVLGTRSQSGHVAVQLDPALQVRAEQLEGCETVVPAQIDSWLADAQRVLTRLVLRFDAVPYSAQLRVTPRQPQVSSLSVSNVRVTDRTIEETILLDFTVREAGIRELRFLLPEWMAKARIDVPHLRQQDVEPVENAAEGLPHESMVRVRLQLQDELLGQLRVLIQHDRLLGDGPQRAPLPVVETGRVDQRFVTLESAGRDEVEIVSQEGMQELATEQKEWRKLADLLGDRLTRAYLVRSGDGPSPPRLQYQTRQRQTVETPAARIGLGTTVLVVDSYGAFRCRQTYQVENSTEQFLELELPENAELWAAHVMGEPVKPTVVPGAASDRFVRIPLIKTEAGDSDYPVVIKYGGRMKRLQSLGQVEFPLLRTVNIPVELSQAQLFLPEQFRWFGFEGSARRVFDQDDLEAGYFQYKTRQIQNWTEALSSSNPFTRARASNNLKQLGLAMQNYQDLLEGRRGNDQLQQQVAESLDALRRAESQLEAVEELTLGEELLDNRAKLNSVFLNQSNGRAVNVVTDAESNFYQAEITPRSGSGQAKFNREWLSQNDLRNPMETKDIAGGKRITKEAGALKNQLEAGQQPQSQLVPHFGLADEPAADPQGRLEGKSKGESRGQSLGDLKDALRNYTQELQTQQRFQAAGQPPTAERTDADGDSGRWGEQAEGQNGQAARELREQLEYSRDGRAEAWARDGERRVDGWDATTATGFAAGDAHLASLDVEIPERGTRFRFASRDELQIRARLVETRTLDRVLRVLVIGLAALALGLVLRRLERRNRG